MAFPEYIKSDEASLDYKFDLAALTNARTGATEDYLQAGETIATIDGVTMTGVGLTVDSSTLADSSTSVVVWISGCFINNVYDVTLKFTTSAARTDTKTIRIFCRKT